MWQAKAACRGPQAASFFRVTRGTQGGKGHARASAKAICSECHVRDDCLDYAIRIREPHGIWGGLNEMERKLLLERRAG